MGFVKLCINLSTIILGCLYEGFVLSKLWAWYIVPTFSLPLFGALIGIGIALMVRMVTIRVTLQDLKHIDDNELLALLWSAFWAALKPTIFLGIGFLFSLFI